MKGQGQKLALCFAVGDAVVAASSWVLAYWLRFHVAFVSPPPDGVPPIDWCLRGLPFIALFTLVSARIARLYDLNRLRRLAQEFAGIVQANGLLVLMLIAVMFYRRDPYKSRLVVGLFLMLNVVGMAVVRRLAWSVIHCLRGHGFNPSPALIVGSGRVAQKVAATLRANGWTGLAPVGFVDDGAARFVNGLPLLGRIEQLGEIVARERAAYVFVALPLERYAETQRIMDQLSDLLVDVRLVPDIPNVAAMSLHVTELSGLSIVGLRGDPHDGIYRVVKRAMDVLVAATGLAVVSPLLVLIAATIKLTSRGPVFFRQERASLGGEPFQMLKFRTMRLDAESRTGPVWTSENDPRRTWFGCFLRRTSLDELPQLINVLRGEMSIVGPRPERPVFIEKFKHSVPHYVLRHSVKAGITGWAQVHGWRGNTSLRKRVQYDLHYIAHWTPWLDLRIMFLTLFRGLIGRNAY
jgi:Undecaprenyl-phosphate glucose phosphotransferase